MLRYIPHTLSCFLLFVLGMGLSHCKSQKAQATSGQQQCNMEATVVNYVGLDGCGFILKLKDGSLANPVEWPVSQDSLYDGMPVRLSYEEAVGMVSTCMKEDLFIRINCLELPDSATRKCMERIGPTESEWMRKVFMEENPWQVVRYDGDNIHYFYFQQPGKGMLYNCYGDTICDIPGRIYNACARKLTQLKNNKIIWKKEEK